MKIPTEVKWMELRSFHSSMVCVLSWCHAILMYAAWRAVVVLRGANIQKLEELFIDAEKLDEWPNEHWRNVYFDIQFMAGTWWTHGASAAEYWKHDHPVIPGNLRFDESAFYNFDLEGFRPTTQSRIYTDCFCQSVALQTLQGRIKAQVYKLRCVGIDAMDRERTEVTEVFSNLESLRVRTAGNADAFEKGLDGNLGTVRISKQILRILRNQRQKMCFVCESPRAYPHGDPGIVRRSLLGSS